MASRTIAQALRSLATFQPTTDKVRGESVWADPSHPSLQLLSIPELHLHADFLDSALAAAGLRPDAILFLSKHRAESGRPSLTVHPVGNYTEARYGGQPGRLTPAPAALQSELLRTLAAHAQAAAYGGDVTFEVTHHGPLLSTPACFIELGSSETQWEDATAARLIASTILKVAARPLPNYPVVIGLGGGHYAPRFTEATRTRRVHFGHLLPTYATESIPDPATVTQEVARVSSSAVGVYPHAKMLKRDALEQWRAAFESVGLPFVESQAWEPVSESVTS